MQELMVGIADFKIGSGDTVIRTSLGSCIAVCLYSSERKIGGMIHYMLPEAVEKENIKEAKYGNPGIFVMLAQLKKTYRINPKELTARIFGGAKILKNISLNIGGDNEEMAKRILQSEGIKIVGGKTGGDKGYMIDFNLSTGLIHCRIFGSKTEEFKA